MRSKLSKEEKVSLVTQFLKQPVGMRTFADINGINYSTFRDWVRNYQSMGISYFDNTGNHHYTEQFKINAVEEYLSGKGSQAEICKKFKIKSTVQLRIWISKYNNHEKLKTYSGGTRRIMVKGRKTTFEERIDIVKDYIESGGSYEEIAEKYNISYQQIYQWVRKYHEHGINGLQDRRGKRKNPDDLTEIERLRAELKMEQAKVKHLELENRVLKKLKEIERRRY